jgi:predicted kinase
VRPRLVLVTGAPGSGKTTLGRQLGAELRVPFLARDDVRGGLLLTAGAWTDRLDHVPTGEDAVDAFLSIVETTLAAGVSCVVEYVVRTDRPGDLDRLAAAGEVVVIVTDAIGTDARLRRRNATDRLVANRAVLDALGLSSVDEHTDAMIERMRTVEHEMRTAFSMPTLRVDTSDGYRPGLDTVVDFAVTATS